MKRRPYFINEDAGDTLGADLFLSQEMKKVIGDLLKPIKQFHQYNYKLLLQIYHQVFSTPTYENAAELPIANYNPILTWQKIVRISFELIERCYLQNKKDDLLIALYKTMESLGPLQKVEFFSSKDLPQTFKLENLEQLEKTERSSPADNLRKMLIHYHDLYDGTYKICLSLFHFLCDLIENKISNKKPYEKYIEDDVSYKIDKLEKYSASVHLQDNLSWLLIGADNHVRNAIAHKNWNFINNKVSLFDKSGWKKDFEFIEIEDMIKNINIANKGMQAGLLIGFSMYQKEMLKLVPRKIHDEETIHSTFYFFANKQSFLLDDFYISGNDIYCELKEKTKYKLPDIGKRTERIMGLIFEACQFIWNYKKIIFQVFSWEGKNVGNLEVDLEKFANLYFSERKVEKSEFESCILNNNIIEDSASND